MRFMKLALPIAGLVKIQSKGDKADIDSSFSKLHYKISATILFLSATLVTSYEIFGKPIDCMSSLAEEKKSALNSFCWISSTFSIPSAGDIIRHAYYQWVPFSLCLQGVMFYLPHYLWKMYEDEWMKKITDGLRGHTLNIDERKDLDISEKKKTLVKNVKETFHQNKWYAGVFFVCDLMNLLNTIFQMYFINVFLGGVFMDFGPQVLSWTEMDQENRTDPILEVFPRLTNCFFHQYGPTGKIGNVQL